MTTKKEENKRMMNEVYRKREVKKNAPITKEEYLEYKEKGHSDTKIMKYVKMHNAGFNEWKHAVGLIGKDKDEDKKTQPQPSQSTMEKQKVTTPMIEDTDLLPFEIKEENQYAVGGVVTQTADQLELLTLKDQVKRYQAERDHWFGMHDKTEKQLEAAAEETKEIKSENKNLREELDSTEFKYKNMLDERETLYIQVAKLEEMKLSQPYDLQSQQAYKSLKSEYEEMKKKVDLLRDAEDLSIALARRYVLLSEAVSV